MVSMEMGNKVIPAKIYGWDKNAGLAWFQWKWGTRWTRNPDIAPQKPRP